MLIDRKLVGHIFQRGRYTTNQANHGFQRSVKLPELTLIERVPYFYGFADTKAPRHARV